MTHGAAAGGLVENHRVGSEETIRKSCASGFMARVETQRYVKQILEATKGFIRGTKINYFIFLECFLIKDLER